ncbi:NUDIX hydrolase [Devosia sp.]|uniref:NUDIX hydrolase n=1 Tax=Devosia sp. TaxID=1871048 RepID=UPI003265A4F1
MSERVVLSFPSGRSRFNYRVAGIAIRDGHILVCREDDDDYCMLPGGRVEMGEPSRLALEREMAEELAMPVTVGRLLYTSENFYEREEQAFHELGFFYEIDLPADARPNGQAPWLSRADEGHMLHFHWLPVTGPALAEFQLWPGWLQQGLDRLPAATEHVVYKDSDRP